MPLEGGTYCTGSRHMPPDHAEEASTATGSRRTPQSQPATLYNSLLFESHRTNGRTNTRPAPPTPPPQTTAVRTQLAPPPDSCTNKQPAPALELTCYSAQQLAL
ncbi:uncharacterized protein BDR25DRAFT_358977 [Lindgomyces ingoldianus]|uniref:Uncharacterized protein n=1 Tax=Lindgomyces ingoldianus TaxID=673940 RepID=A0ACB6QJ46_9PLEO|nr:uncharacterized protein BDR25DRAFT_358977 [Lindgomyces ingoldianus]KAF2466920.1 hypothetical protein BDR25DRAFT_358977 [Lindgomyces ingoldianus]